MFQQKCSRCSQPWRNVIWLLNDSGNGRQVPVINPKMTRVRTCLSSNITGMIELANL